MRGYGNNGGYYNHLAKESEYAVTRFGSINVDVRDC